MLITKNDVPVNPCPICGRKVKADVNIKMIEPKANIYSDCWHIAVLFRATCEACYIHQDTSISDSYVEDEERDEYVGRYEKQLIDFWNNLPRRKETEE